MQAFLPKFTHINQGKTEQYFSPTCPQVAAVISVFKKGCMLKGCSVFYQIYKLI